MEQDNSFYNQGTNLVNRPASGYTPDKFEAEALEAIKYEKGQWEDAAVFLTERVQYLMRRVIDRARRYYYGVFDVATDEVTGDKKTWVPLTEWSVESVVKSIDLDTKDILIEPGHPNAVGVTPIIRALVMDLLKRVGLGGFGQLLNDLTRALARDGTVVVKTYTIIDPATKRKVIKSKIIDLLDLWLDPASDSIQEGTVIERQRMSEADINDYADVWQNTQYVNFSLNVPRLLNQWTFGTGKMPYTEVWERWGKIKLSWITKDEADSNTWVEGHIVASGLNSPHIVHLIRENPSKSGYKPYEEAWYKRVDGRWYGRGIAEMLFGLQEYANTVVNIRKSNNLLLQNGIFLVRKGSGLTPDMVSSISAGGGLPVTDIERDVKQLQVQDYRQSSYTDEDRINSYADRVTGSFDINRGEAGRASASATATLTQDRHIRDTFVLVQEGIGFFIERLIIRQYLPMLKEIMKTDDLIKITGDADELAFIDQSIIEHRTNEYKRQVLEDTGFLPEDSEIQKYQEDQYNGLKKMGKNRFVTYFRNMFDENVDVDITVTDERFNRIVAVQQLRDSLVAFSRLPVASKLNTDAVLREMFNLMGIKGEFFLEAPQLPVLAKGIAQTGRLMKDLPTGLPSEVGALQNAAGIQQGGPQAAPGQIAPGQTAQQQNSAFPDFTTRINVAAPLAPITQ